MAPKPPPPMYGCMDLACLPIGLRHVCILLTQQRSCKTPLLTPSITPPLQPNQQPTLDTRYRRYHTVTVPRATSPYVSILSSSHPVVRSAKPCHAILFIQRRRRQFISSQIQLSKNNAVSTIAIVGYHQHSCTIFRCGVCWLWIFSASSLANQTFDPLFTSQTIGTTSNCTIVAKWQIDNHHPPTKYDTMTFVDGLQRRVDEAAADSSSASSLLASDGPARRLLQQMGQVAVAAAAVDDESTAVMGDIAVMIYGVWVMHQCSW